MSICLKDFGVVCAAGHSKQMLFDNFLDANYSAMVADSSLCFEGVQWLAKVDISAAGQCPKTETRNNQLAYIAYQQIAPVVTALLKQFPAERVAVVIGTSTSGTYEGEIARVQQRQGGKFPEDYRLAIQEMGEPANYIASLSGAKGPVYGISTACSSSGKALSSASALIDAGLVDVVIAGGVDSLTKLTVNGFQSLESVSKGVAAPFSEARDGINIGEAAALFVLTKEDSGIQLLGTGECSDAYHISAPHPEGAGAKQAMQLALAEAGVNGEQLDYVNLHGTGTIKNDEMEALALYQICADKVACSSTKRLTGHTLGAAGALEVGICWLLLSDLNDKKLLPVNGSSGVLDASLAAIKLSDGGQLDKLNLCMSNSFAFGGSNFSAVLGFKNV